MILNINPKKIDSKLHIIADAKIVTPFLTSSAYAIPKPGKKNDIANAIASSLSTIIITP